MTRISAAAPITFDIESDEPTAIPPTTATIVRLITNSSRLAAIAPCRRPARSRRQTNPVERRIRAFLDGETNGESLLHELYDSILDEPIPERMRALLES